MTEGPDEAAGTAPGRTASGRGRTVAVVGLALVAGVVAGLAGVYGIGGLPRNADAVPASPVAVTGPPGAVNGQPGAVDGECSEASRIAGTLAPFAKGEVAAFAPTLQPRKVPDLAFQDGDGKPLTLSQVGGSGLRLVNIWATWCVPCRKEMPALDKLQAELGGKNFSVVAVNVDTRDPAKPRAFLNEIGIRNLAYYVDPKAQSFQDLRAAGRGFGLPTTLLVDAKGCEIGYMAGPAEWAGPDALALLRAAL